MSLVSPTVMLVMLGTRQVEVPLDPHRLGGRRSITLVPRAPCLAGFVEQALLPRCVTGTRWGWHKADEGWEPVTRCWLYGPVTYLSLKY